MFLSGPTILRGNMRNTHFNNRILIVGFGDIGERVAKYLRGKPGVAVTALVRNADAAQRARAVGVQVIRGDLARPQSLKKLAGMSTIFHFAPPPAEGKRDLHTRHLLAALSATSRRTGRRAGMLSQPSRRSFEQAKPARLIYISTTGVYGDCGGEWIDESRPVNPGTDRAVRRVDAERAILAWGRSKDARVSILRAPGIYAEDRLPIERLRKGTAALRDEDDVFTNHIHAEDLARAVLAAMRQLKPARIYNAVDDSSMKMGQYFDRVADAFGIPRAPRISRGEAKEKLSPALLSFMSESRRISNARLKRELRFKFHYASVDDFLRELTAQKS